MTDWRLGTSSWSEPAWVGPFYPPGTPAGLFLTLYAQRYRAVEADVTYYRVPTTRLTRGWRDKLPEDFRLCAKFPRSVVHGGSGASPDPERILDRPEALADAQRFLEAMAELGDRAGPLLLQFPYFNQRAFPGPAPFFERLERLLDALPSGPRLAVEVRNKAWIGPELLALLRRRGAGLALVDLAYLPHPDEWPAKLGGEPQSLLSARFLYARLIGDRQRTEAAAERFDRIVLDQEPRLARWAALLARLAPGVDEVFAFANNHYAGYAPATIDALATKLGL
jgi:uncharacterized protein YecE (DUF72 family)